MLVSHITKIIIIYRKQQNVYLKQLKLITSGFQKELCKAQLEVHEETCQQISLELHDNVGHLLSLAKLHLASVNTPLPNHATEKVEAAILLISHSLDEIRNISKNMNTENIKSTGLVNTVQQQIEQLNKLGQFKVCFTVIGQSRYLEDIKEIALYRILQESVSNILKHSKASLVHIVLHYDDDKLLLSIQDNGIGFTMKNPITDENKWSSGLRNIIKRSSSINAIPEILSVPNKGTSINITTPY